MTTLLIVEDEMAIRELVAFVCETEGYATVRASTIAEAREAVAHEMPDLVLLDMMLPDDSGLNWLKSLRTERSTVGLPVIMLTARGDETDRVAGLDAGADDYIVKPFLPRELVARVRAVLRRREQSSSAVARKVEADADDAEIVVRCGPLVMNEARFEATVDGVPLKLSAKEFKLLYIFATKPGRVFTRAQLLSSVWQSAFVDERTVDVHMLRLRKALAGTAVEDFIETVRGIGYRGRSFDHG